MTSWREYLTSDPEVCGGQLCAKGTRVTVTNILDSLVEGSTTEEILRSYLPVSQAGARRSRSGLCCRARPGGEPVTRLRVMRFKIDETCWWRSRMTCAHWVTMP